MVVDCVLLGSLNSNVFSLACVKTDRGRFDLHFPKQKNIFKNSLSFLFLSVKWLSENIKNILKRKTLKNSKSALVSFGGDFQEKEKF